MEITWLRSQPYLTGANESNCFYSGALNIIVVIIVISVIVIIITITITIIIGYHYYHHYDYIYQIITIIPSLLLKYIFDSLSIDTHFFPWTNDVVFSKSSWTYICTTNLTPVPAMPVEVQGLYSNVISSHRDNLDF